MNAAGPSQGANGSLVAGRRATPRANAWSRLDGELDAWHALGRRAGLWCRDDDACRDSPALRELFDVALAAEIPVALAVIPARIESDLVGVVAQAPGVTVVQHGYAHRNHAPPGARNWELGLHRPLEETVAELALGRHALESAFGQRFAAVLVPPWNRIEPQVIARLPGAGFAGLSTFGTRHSVHPCPGLVQCNTHVDLIAWRRDRAFIGVDAAVDRLVDHLAARRAGTADPAEATGILTHHLDLDAAAWQFLGDLFTRTRRHPAVRWLDVHAVFEK